MPELRCTNEDCGETFFVRSELAIMGACPHCEEEGTLVEAGDDDPGPPPTAVKTTDYRVAARAAADQLLAEQGVTQPRVDVEAIARALGLQVVRAEMGEVSGELRDQRIRLNKGDPTTKQRFTIAHELGHHRLHTVHDAGSLAEKQANAFAGALLVPPEMLRRAVSEGPDFDALRRLFDVSREVTTIALKDAGLAGRVSKS